MSWNNHPHAASFPKRSGLFRRGPNLPPTVERNRKSIAVLVAPRSSVRACVAKESQGVAAGRERVEDAQDKSPLGKSWPLGVKRRHYGTPIYSETAFCDKM